MTLLTVSDVRISYGDIVAVNGVSFTVQPNEVFVLLGANGAGKSSLLRCISGLIAPRSGTIMLEGRLLNGLVPYQITRAGVSHVPEGRHIFAHQSVRENLAVSFIRRGKETRKLAFERVFELFPRLRERQNQVSGSMSGGEQQMVAIGRALMNNPSVLMLDEPSLGLSPLLTEQVFERIRMISQLGTSILLVEQNAASLELATRGLVLANGEGVLQGEARALATSDFVREAYLGM